jgi:hypothetical protein
MRMGKVLEATLISYTTVLLVMLAFCVYFATGCAGRVINTIEWGETLDGGMKMEMSREDKGEVK